MTVIDALSALPARGGCSVSARAGAVAFATAHPRLGPSVAAGARTSSSRDGAEALLPHPYSPHSKNRRTGESRDATDVRAQAPWKA